MAGALPAGAQQDQRSVWDMAESQRVIGRGGFGGSMPRDMSGSMQMTNASPALSTPAPSAPAAPVGAGDQFASLKNMAVSAYQGELPSLKSVAGTLRDEFRSMSRFVRRAGAGFGSGFRVKGLGAVSDQTGGANGGCAVSRPCPSMRPARALVAAAGAFSELAPCSRR